MPLQDLTPLPVAPQRSDDPDTFIERADDFVAALPVLVSEINTLSDQLELTAALINAAPAYADAGLVALTGLTPAADKVPYWTGAGTSATMTVTSAARSLLDDTTTGAMLTTLGFSAFAKTLIDDADASAVRTTLGLGSAALSAAGDFQAADPELSALAGLTSAAGKVPYFTGSGTAGVTDSTSYGRSLLNLADQAAAFAIFGVSSSSLIANNGYRVAPDGFAECWGSVSVGAGSTAVVNMPYTFTSFSVFTLGPFIKNSASAQNNMGLVSQSLNSFTIRNWEDTSLTCNWSARGV